MDSIYRKDGMGKGTSLPGSVFQAAEGGKEVSFIFRLDDMFLSTRGWAFTSVSPRIGKETKNDVGCRAEPLEAPRT